MTLSLLMGVLRFQLQVLLSPWASSSVVPGHPGRGALRHAGQVGPSVTGVAEPLRAWRARRWADVEGPAYYHCRHDREAPGERGSCTCGVARSWFYALLARYQEKDDAAFEPGSRRPKTSPNSVSPDAVELISRLHKELAGRAWTSGRIPSAGTCGIVTRSRSRQ